MSNKLLVIVDDDSGAFSYGWSGGSNTSSPWILSTLTQWYRATSWYTFSSDQTGTFTFTFSGTSAAFIGNTPALPEPQTATVQIDNGTPFDINYEDPNPPTYQQWFVTPTLPDGPHNVTISNLYQTAIDYAVVTVGNNTSLTGQTIIVDDSSSLIHYSGEWSESTEEFIPGSLPIGYPYANGTHRSSNSGDTFSFQFSGTSIAVYGIFSWFDLGVLTATYSIDGSPYSSSISVTTSSPSYLNKDGEVSNYLYFGHDSLSSGTHSLLVNITEATNQTFILDYITYTPSFDTLSSMPSLSSNVTSMPSSTATGSQHSASTGAIVGGVIGGLAFGVLMTILVILFILRRRRALERDYAYQDTTLSSSVNSPNTPQMQERLSPLRPQHSPISPFNISNSRRPFGRDAKNAQGHENLRSSSGAGHNVNNAATVSSIAGNSTGVEETLVDPPSYDAISNFAGHQP